MLTISKVFTILCLLRLCCGIESIIPWVAFKTNQYALLSNECPSVFCSWPNVREKEDILGVGKHRSIL